MAGKRGLTMITGFRFENDTLAADVDRAWERATDRMIDQMSGDNDPVGSRYWETAESLTVALEHLDKAHDWILEASAESNGLNGAECVGDLEDQISDMINSVKRAKEKMLNGGSDW